MTMIVCTAAMIGALGIDAVVGWPGWLYARIGHPVTWIGALIARLDSGWNRPAWSALSRRLTGLAAALGVIGVAAGAGLVLQALLPDGPLGLIAMAVFAWPLIAARSMHDHVDAVYGPLSSGDLDSARASVAMIVGRDPAGLDAAGVSRATLESLAENTSDGIVAPVFWGVLLGLPGIAAYKAVNTLDSMIGHRTPRHEAFGWAAARIDDAANLIPARLTGLLFALASGRPMEAVGAMVRDARRHRSPNAGWPEAAMAGALGVRLSGPRVYDGRVSNEPWLNAAARDPDADDVAAGLRLYRRAIVGLVVLLVLTIVGLA
ncbi:MAG: adenosylcobinamide-phosphate synthase CbiB [Hyphomicrobiaceae bacterium]|nr:adenosylcobinamide-phosphate synthase CbiB [Hyphomicrobiaceae bacterium]